MYTTRLLFHNKLYAAKYFHIAVNTIFWLCWIYIRNSSYVRRWIIGYTIQIGIKPYWIFHFIQQNTLNEFIRETYLSDFQRYWKETKSKLTSCGEVSLVHKSWMSLKNARYSLIKWNHYGSRRRIMAVEIGRMAFI